MCYRPTKAWMFILIPCPLTCVISVYVHLLRVCYVCYYVFVYYCGMSVMCVLFFLADLT